MLLFWPQHPGYFRQSMVDKTLIESKNNVKIKLNNMIYGIINRIQHNTQALII